MYTYGDVPRLPRGYLEYLPNIVGYIPGSPIVSGFVNASPRPYSSRAFKVGNKFVPELTCAS